MRSLLITGCTLLIWACILTLPAPEAKAAAREVPLVIRAVSPELTPNDCGYWTALALATGFDVRRSGGEEQAWVAELDLNGDNLQATLTSPDGVLTAVKGITVDVPCADAIEILAILLAAHVPAFALEIQRTPRPQAEPPANIPPETPPPTAEAEVVTGPPTEVEDTSSKPTTVVRVFAAPALVLLASKPRYLLSAGAELRVQRWWLGLRLGGSYQREKVRAGRATIAELDSRATGGYAVVDEGGLHVHVGALAGARLTLGSTTALYKNSSESIASAQIGLFAEGRMSLAESFELLLGTTAVRLLPKPSFAVRGSGRIYQTPELLLELCLGLAWRAAW